MKRLILFLVFILSLRLISLGLYDVYDSTEGRYASIAMRMAESGNFTTPMFLPNIPFLAKPPLAFWASAISFKVFGSYHELFARLPHFLAMLFALFGGFFAIKKVANSGQALIFGILLGSVPGFWILAGSVMTDGFLVLGITITNLSFFFAVNHEKYKFHNKARWVFALGLLISALSKGIIGMILSGIACLVYTIIKKKWKALINLHTILALTAFFILALPWFYLMQKQNPEFLNYFFIGEHFQRFLISEWEGDKYGYAHSQPFGMIWIFFIFCTFQVGIYFLFLLTKTYKTIKIDDFKLFLIISTLTPLAFFSFARNIIIPYAGLVIIPFCMLASQLFETQMLKRIIPLSLPFAILLFLGFAVFSKFFTETDKKLITEFQNQNSNQKVLYYIGNPDFSSYFYTKDSIKRVPLADIKKGEFYIVRPKIAKGEKIICNKDRCLYKK